MNSGPPGFVNGGGHANFDPSGRMVATGAARIGTSAGVRIVEEARRA